MRAEILDCTAIMISPCCRRSMTVSFVMGDSQLSHTEICVVMKGLRLEVLAA
jgi:hypothetical protein